MKRLLTLFSALIILGILCGCGGAATETAEEKIDLTRTTAAVQNALDGAAYIVTESECYPVTSGLREGYVTPDRNNVVMLTESGELSYSNAAMENIVEVSGSVASVSDIRNDGFFYTSEDSITYRVRFGAEENDKLGEDVRYTVAKHTTSVLYATTEGKIFLLGCDTADKVRIGTFEDRVTVWEVSDNGGIAVWLLNEGKQYTPVIYNRGDKKTCEPYSSNYPGFSAELSKDQKMVVLGSYYSNTVYFAKEGEEAVKVSLPDDLFLPIFYSEKGRIRDTNAEDVRAVFFNVDAKSGTNFYGMTLDGEKERLLTNTAWTLVENGNVIYLDDDENLYIAAVSAAGLEEGKKISGGVDRVRMPLNGRYVYFTRNADNGVATLCVYNVEKDSVQKIADECADKLCVSTDGAAVFYFKNTANVKDTYSISYGDLYGWTYSEENAESVKIASDVLIDSLTSFLASGEVEKDCFVFERFNARTKKDETACISYDLVRWNGTETEKVQSELYKDIA